MSLKSQRNGSQTVRTTIEEVIIDGRDATIDFDRVTTWVHDPKYGADADGRRGMPMDFIDEDYADNIVVQFEDINDQFVFAQLTEHQQKRVVKVIDTFLEEHDPEWQEVDNEPPEIEEWERRMNERERMDEDDERGGRR